MVGRFDNYLAKYRQEVAEQGISGLRDKLSSGAIAHSAKALAANCAIEEHEASLANQASKRQQDREAPCRLGGLHYGMLRVGKSRARKNQHQSRAYP